MLCPGDDYKASMSAAFHQVTVALAVVLHPGACDPEDSSRGLSICKADSRSMESSHSGFDQSRANTESTARCAARSAFFARASSTSSKSPRTPSLRTEPILSILYCFNLSRAVLKSSRTIVSERHLNTNANFQKGLIPSGRPLSGKTCVTARMSTMIKPTETSIAPRRIPNLGDTRMSSM